MTHESDSHATPERATRLRNEVEEALAAIALPDTPSSLYDPVRYVLGAGGKRVRPVLVLLAAEMFGGNRRNALPAALAVEVFHNFTLVHDDIMDHSSTRRGKQTVHVRWDEPTAILAGDYLMALSYRLLTDVPESLLGDVHRVFDQMVVRLCEGQALDKAYESVPKITISEYLGMIDAKTGALLEASLEIGGVCGRASASERAALREAGKQLGRAFQVQDDLLDVVAKDDRWGKTVGSDLVEGKKTFLLVSALENSEGAAHTLFERVAVNGGIGRDEVALVRQTMDEQGILASAREAVSTYTQNALNLLQSVGQESDARRTLIDLVHRMRARLH